MESGRKLSDFIAHNGDVVSISISPDGNSFVTGSVDKTCRLWDIREEKPKQTFFGHDSDVNSVCVFKNNMRERMHDTYESFDIFSSIPMVMDSSLDPKTNQRDYLTLEEIKN